MKTLGNLIWFIFGGVLVSLCWFFTGLLWCVSIIGIPVGVQCFKFAGLALWPFGKEIEYSTATVSVLTNILWLIFGGFELATATVVSGLLLCVTIIGIPFGLQMFKLAKLALMPFGAKIVTK